MRGFNVPEIPNAEKWSLFSSPDATRSECSKSLMVKLRTLSTWTTAVGRVMLADPEFSINDALREQMTRAFWGYVKYWAHQGSYINEYKWVDLPPLATSNPDDLTADGKRHIRESLAQHYISEISRFYFLAQFGTSDYTNWSLASTTDDWWIDQWSELETNPESLDVPSKAMVAMREENARKKRLENEQGPANADTAEISKETPEQAFRRMFVEVQDAAAAAASGGGGGVVQKQKPRFLVTPDASTGASGAGGGIGRLWFRPVCQYTQRNVYDAVMLLTERIQDYPFHQDIVTFISCLTARLGLLFLQPARANVFDIERYREPLAKDWYRCNRKFMAWAAAYFYELLQRVHYQTTMRTRVQPIVVSDVHIEALRANILRLCEEMGPSTFATMYRLCTEENYAFPGDDVFSRFLHPEGLLNRGDVLLELRSERQAPRFFSENELDAKTIVQNMLAAESHIARLCVWNVLDWYFNMEVAIKLRDAVVIDQCGIELSQTLLIESTIPCFVTLFSRPVAHYDFCFYESDDIYRVIVQWLLLIRDQKQGFLFRKDISRQIATLLGEQEQPAERRAYEPTDDFAEVQELLVDHFNNLVCPL